MLYNTKVPNKANVTLLTILPLIPICDYFLVINEMNDNSSLGSDDDIAVKYQKLATEFAKVVLFITLSFIRVYSYRGIFIIYWNEILDKLKYYFGHRYVVNA